MARAVSLKTARRKRKTARKKGKSGIYIRPQNRGKLRKATKTKKGQKIPVSKLQKMKKSRDPKVRRRATFALNARKWGKGRRK
jgi:oligoendopeptidase F